MLRSWMGSLISGILCVPLWPALPSVFLAWGLSVMACLTLFGRRLRYYAVSGFLAGLSLGIFHGDDMLSRRLPEVCVGHLHWLEGQIVSLPRVAKTAEGAPWQRFEITVSSLSSAACGAPQRILLSYYGPQELNPGERWRFLVRLKRPWGLSNPGSHSFQAWYAQSGIDALGSVSGDNAELLMPADSWDQPVQRARKSISTAINDLPMESQVKAVLRAITVADNSGMGNELWSLLQVFGVNHLMVISGLHIGLVAGFAYVLSNTLVGVFALLGRHRQLLVGTAMLISAVAYAALAGFSLPTQRALCMLAAFIIADMVGLRGRAFNTLLIAALIILVGNPLAALGSGFWLSFGAVCALLWFSVWQRRSRYSRLITIHLYMCLVMVPLGGWWFGGASLVAGPANFVMIPLIGMVVVPLALVGVLCHLLDLTLAASLWQLAGWPLDMLLPLANGFARDASPWLYQAVSVSTMEMLLGLLAVLLLPLPRGYAPGLIACVCCMPMLLPPANLKQTDPGWTRVTVFDVGQGTAVLIEAGHRTLLYDTGGGDPAGVTMAGRVILPYLRSRGIDALDTFIVSHPDLDHSAGTAAVLRAATAERERFGGQLSAMPGGQSCVAGESWQWPTGQIFQILSPALEHGLESNNGSCVLSIRIGGVRLLLPGDIEAGRERQLVQFWGSELRSDWLLAPHHGSKTSSSLALLKHVAPKIIVITHGYANRFGHPHPRVLQRLRDTGAQVYSTAREGALRFDITPEGKIISASQREQSPRYWK